MRSFIYRILEIPLIYNLVQFLLAPGSDHFLNKYFGNVFANSTGRILDVGCGPKLTTPLSGTQMTGVDVNLSYIKDYSDPEKQNGVVAKGESIPFRSDSFDEARCFGLVHHLTYELNVQLIREMIRCTRSGGQVIVIDSVMPKNAWLRPFAWMINKLDRGPYMLKEEEFDALVQEAQQGQWNKTDRYTYTLIGHEAITFTYQKP